MRAIFDAHLDLAWNALQWNRDLTQPLAEVRAAEATMTDHRARGWGTVTLPELRDDLLVPVFSVARRVAAAMEAGFGADGTFVANNNRISQSVAHLHVHVVPRTKGDGLRGFFWPRTKYADGEAADYARRLRSALG